MAGASSHLKSIPRVGSVSAFNWRKWIAPIAIALGSTAALHLVERSFRILHPEILTEGYRFQDWSSNWMMQTLGLDEMASFGPKAFWYSHVYPPLEDMIRYVFMLPETNAGQPPSQVNVDFRLYALYAVIYGLVNALLFVWVRSLTRSGWWALGVTVVWAVHPGYLTLMLLLDPSPLAMITISFSLYALYMFLRYRNLLWTSAFFAAVLMASLARTITQLHVLAILLIAYVSFWFMAKMRHWWIMVLNAVLVAMLFIVPIKMQIMYKTWDVTTYAGYHRSGPLWIDPRSVPEPAYPKSMIDNALVFSSRYNTQEQVKDNYRLSMAANDFLIHHPLESAQNLAKSLAITVPEALRPASMYTQNYLVERLPWRSAWDWVFSEWRYLILLGASAAMICWARGWRGMRRLLGRYGWFAVYYLLLALPILFSNRYYPQREAWGPIWTDAIRQKVFLEIPVWALMGYSLWLSASKRGRREWSVRRHADSGHGLAIENSHGGRDAAQVQ